MRAAVQRADARRAGGPVMWAAVQGADARRAGRLVMRLLLTLISMMLLCQAAPAAPPEFAPVLPLAPGRALKLPDDSGAHPAFRTEWWYLTGWLKTPDGKPLGFQVTFFRSATAHDRANPSAFAPKQLIIGHAALSDPAVGKLVHEQKSAREGFGLADRKSNV